MFAHFLTSILRNIRQHFKLNAINTIGVSAGIASCLITVDMFIINTASINIKQHASIQQRLSEQTNLLDKTISL